jgi:hypothetical protein
MTKATVCDFEFWLLVLIWSLALGICNLEYFWFRSVHLGDEEVE